ncbi:MAG: hypothetical protein ABIQ18_21465 [Umezawaea sp.]
MLRGHTDIKTALDARPGPEPTVRHLVTNLHFHTIADDSAHGVSCLTAYAGPTSTVTGPARYPAANAGHVVQVMIGDADAIVPGIPSAPAEQIAPVYWELHNNRDNAKHVFTV